MILRLASIEYYLKFKTIALLPYFSKRGAIEQQTKAAPPALTSFPLTVACWIRARN
jgi:hypothetical protein